MAYFRTLSKIQLLLDLFHREDEWLILINADPDALASAMALKRIMSRRVGDVQIAKVNEVTRPDNLAMLRYTRIQVADLTPGLLRRSRKLALVDSQPHHHPMFKDREYQVIIDHHPLTDASVCAPYTVVKPEYGATSTLLTEHLYNLNLRPGKLLATALQFGIKTDTASFERHFCDVDLRAYQYLSRFADHNLLSRIARSEFHRRWLDLFARACSDMYPLGSGQYVFLGEVDNPDVLVLIADFFMRVYEIRWVAVAGLHGETAVVVFRGDGVSRDLGRYASRLFGEIGSAGGHKAMARAEFPVTAAGGKDPELFIWQRLTMPGERPHSAANGANLLPHTADIPPEDDIEE